MNDMIFEPGSRVMYTAPDGTSEKCIVREVETETTSLRDVVKYKLTSLDSGKCFITENPGTRIRLISLPVHYDQMIPSRLKFGFASDKKKGMRFAYEMPTPKKVIFNGPVTIVYWDDGTKTIVKCDDIDLYDQDSAMIMATLKKIFGSTTNALKYIDKFHGRRFG